MKFERVYEKTNFITGLRAIAILLVFLIHSGGGGLRQQSDAMSVFVDFGKYGVPMFFVISGFTIFYQFFEGRYTLRHFLFNRVSRISLPYFPILILLFLYVKLGGEQFVNWAIRLNEGEVSITNILLHFSYLASFGLNYANSIIGVEWLLNVEVFFYFIIGFLITKKLIQPQPFNILIWLLLSSLLAVVTIVVGYFSILNPLTVQWLPLRYGWMFILGGLGYFYRYKINSTLSERSVSTLSNITIVSSVLIILVLINFKSLNSISLLNEAIFATVTFLLLIFTRDSEKLTIILTNKVMIFLGTISFSFYLLHYIVISSNISSVLLGFSGVWELFLSDLLLSILISFFWYKIFEQLCYQKIKLLINYRLGK